MAANSIRFQSRPTGDFTSELSRRTVGGNNHDEEANSPAPVPRHSWWPKWLGPSTSELPRMSRSITTADEENKALTQGKAKKLGTFDGVCARIGTESFEMLQAC